MPGLPHSMHHDMVGTALSAKTHFPLIEPESAIAMRRALAQYSEILLQRLPEHTLDWTFEDHKAFEQAAVVTTFIALNDPAADPDAYATGVRALSAYRTNKRDGIIPLFAGDATHTIVRPSAINHLVP